MQTLRVVSVVAIGVGFVVACTGGPAIDTSSSSSSSSSSSGGTSSSGISTTSSSSSGIVYGTSTSSSSSSSGNTGSSCRTQGDCTTSGNKCIGGNVPAGCGGAVIHECDTDFDCQADGGVRVCQLGDCQGVNRCIDPQCTGPSDPSCGINETCENKQCVHKSCITDTDCTGYCVNSVCSLGLGVCNQQAEYP